MKFLYVMISTVWIMYSWVCVDALQWKPPYNTPDRVSEILNKSSLEAINISIEKSKLYLDSAGLTEFQRAVAKKELATGYWLKAYYQNSRKTQTAYLNLSINVLKEYLQMAQSNPEAKIWIADMYTTIQEFENADAYYQDARKHFPNDRSLRHRHRRMIRSWNRLKESSA